jgi:hypothetical protein
MNKLSTYQTAHMKYPYTLAPLNYAYDGSSRISTYKRCSRVAKGATISECAFATDTREANDLARLAQFSWLYSKMKSTSSNEVDHN